MTSLAASPVVMHVQLHPGLQPALGHLLPQVVRVLVEVDHLLISVLHVERAELLHELHLLSLQVSIISIAFTVSEV